MTTTPTIRIRHLILALVAMVVALSACGGSSVDDTTVSTNRTGTSTESTSEATSSTTGSSRVNGSSSTTEGSTASSTAATPESAPAVPVTDGEPDPAPAPAATDEPSEAAVVDDRFDVVTGSTPAGDYSAEIMMPAASRTDENEFWEIIDTIWTFQDGSSKLVFTVTDKTGHFEDEEDAGMQKISTEFAVVEATNFEVFEMDTHTPIVFAPNGPETAINGHEATFTYRGELGRARSILKDKVVYSMVAINVSDADWDYFTNSLVTHEIDAAAIASANADAEADAALVASAATGEAFVEGPYGEREMAPMSGGWEHVAAPPFGAIEPGTDEYLDEMWVGCREGRAEDCDELYWQSDLNSDYERFALTCGGRTVTDACVDILGGEVHPEGEPAEEMADDQFRNRLRLVDLTTVPAFDSPPPGGDPAKDALWVKCGLESDHSACYELREDHTFFSTVRNVYTAFGLTCGGRIANGQTCATLFTDPADLVQSGTPAPGEFDDEANELWDACAADPATACEELSFHMIFVEGEGDRTPYNRFARTCGGRGIDQPIHLGDCSDYVNWPLVDNVSDLPR